MNDDRVVFSFNIRPYPGAIRVRPSKAKLRKIIRDKTSSRLERMQAWAFLQYRRKHGMR